MPVFTAFVTLGVGLFSFLSGEQDREFNKELSEETIRFGREQLSQENEQFLATLGLTREELELRKEELGFQMDEAARDRRERMKDKIFAKKKLGTELGLGLFGQQSGLTQQMLSMWDNTGFTGGGGQAGAPPAQQAPVGEGVFGGRS